MSDENKTEETQKKLLQQWADDANWLLSTPEGERIFWWIMNATGYMKHNIYSGQTNDTIMKSAKHDVGKKLFDDLMFAQPELVSTILRKEYENADRESTTSE